MRGGGGLCFWGKILLIERVTNLDSTIGFAGEGNNGKLLIYFNRTPNMFEYDSWFEAAKCRSLSRSPDEGVKKSLNVASTNSNIRLIRELMSVLYAKKKPIGLLLEITAGRSGGEHKFSLSPRWIFAF